MARNMERYVRVVALGAVIAVLASSCTMFAWGSNGSGQLGDGTTVNSSEPVGLDPTFPENGWDDVSSGSGHTCGIRGNGTLWCWGRNDFGQAGVGSTSAVGALRRQVGTFDDWETVTAGDFHTCATRTLAPIVNLPETRYANAYCWGRNDQGQLGDGTTVNRTAPTEIATPGGFGLNGFVEVVAGDRHTCLVGTNGEFYSIGVACTGDNAQGQLGLGDTTDRTTFVAVPLNYSGSPSFTSLAGGGSHTCVLEKRGTGLDLFCWGDNAYGQLGDGTTIDRLTPVDVNVVVPSEIVPVTLDPSVVVAGTSHTCVVGLILGFIDAPACVGRNHLGQLGDGTTVDRASWDIVPDLLEASIASITAGTWHTCASVTETGSDRGVWCWGANNVGQLGDGTTTSQSVATLVPGSDQAWWGLLDSRDGTTCGLRSTQIYCWGYNANGQIGDGTVTQQNSPSELLHDYREVSAGSAHSCRIDHAYELWCWGENGSAQLGLGDFVDRTTPTPLNLTVTSVEAGDATTCYEEASDWFCGGGQFGTGASYIESSVQSFSVAASSVAGFDRMCLVTNGGELQCGTSAPLSQIGSDLDWATVSNSRDGHTCAIKTDGTLWCWGNNATGQLGLGDTSPRVSPTQVGVDTDWSDVATGGITVPFIDDPGHSCAIRTGGTMWCWGANGSGQAGIGAAGSNVLTPAQVGVATNWEEVTSGDSFVCGRRATTLWCWGENGQGQLGIGSLTDQAAPTQVNVYVEHLAVDAGSRYALAITDD